MAISIINPSRFELEVPRGKIAGYSTIIKYGFNTNIAASTPEDIIEQGGFLVFPTAAEVLEVVSDDANDALTGTGAQEVTISGLDASYDELIQTVSLDGTTPQTLVTNLVRANRMYVSASGSGNVNAGTITLRTVSPSTRLLISPGRGQTNVCAASIPRNRSGYITRVAGGLLAGSPSGTDATLEIRTFRDIDQATRTQRLGASFPLNDTSNAGNLVFDPYLRIQGPADIWLRMDTDTNGTIGYGLIDMYLAND